MFIVMQQGYNKKAVDDILHRLKLMGFTGHVSEGVERTVIGVVGQTYPELKETLEAWPGVEDVVPISKPYKLASREFQPHDTVIKVGNVSIGGNEIVVMAGPCAVETEDQAVSTARAVKAAGASILRGGAFKPRTSPYSFQGLGREGLEILAEVRQEFGLAVVTGRNTRLRALLEATAWEIPTFIYGFERRMPQMMQAASLLVTKAGPGTVTEALNAGLPMVLYSYLPGQEEGNVGYVVDQGVGLWAPGPERAANAVSSWLSRPEELKQAAATCRRIARPDAAKRVAEVIASTLSRRFPSPAPGAQSFRTPV